MYLELYFKDGEKTQSSRIENIKTDFQAEKHVWHTRFDPERTAPIFRWILYDEQGIRCVWEHKKYDDPKDVTLYLTQRSSRYAGIWRECPEEIAI